MFAVPATPAIFGQFFAGGSPVDRKVTFPQSAAAMGRNMSGLLMSYGFTVGLALRVSWLVVCNRKNIYYVFFI